VTNAREPGQLFRKHERQGEAVPDSEYLGLGRHAASDEAKPVFCHPFCPLTYSALQIDEASIVTVTPSYRWKRKRFKNLLSYPLLLRHYRHFPPPWAAVSASMFFIFGPLAASVRYSGLYCLNLHRSPAPPHGAQVFHLLPAAVMVYLVCLRADTATTSPNTSVCCGSRDFRGLSGLAHGANRGIPIVISKFSHESSHIIGGAKPEACLPCWSPWVILRWWRPPPVYQQAPIPVE